MQFPNPLVRATLLKRYKRFLADVRLESGDEITIHCPNPGSMTGLATPGAEIWLSPAVNPKAKLPYGWELTRVDDHLVGINTGRPNRIVEEAVSGGQVAELSGYASLRREVRYGKNSRIDLLLEEENGRPPCYVEVKNVHLKREKDAEFPDSVTARGAKHLEELGDMVENGARAVMFYLVQRTDCSRFSIADDIDPAYAKALNRALSRGVETICYDCAINLDGIALRSALPVDV